MTLMTFSKSARLIVLAGTLSVACGGSQPSEPASPSASEPAAFDTASEASADAPPFDELGPAAKLKFMKETVAPQMAKTFQGYDSEHFAEFGCSTCHGPGAKDGDFRMPAAGLPKLPADPTPLFEQEPKVANFMAKQVVPQMAKLLGQAPYDPQTKQGFGCFDCHQKQ